MLPLKLISISKSPTMFTLIRALDFIVILAPYYY
jgi:hypothetical protein